MYLFVCAYDRVQAFKDATIGSLDCLQCSHHFDAFHAVHPLEVCPVSVSVTVIDRF